MAVLINRGSASASEVVALALAENGRAITVGTPSQGKDSIQLELEPLLPLKVTAGRYLGPRGTSVGGRGVMPDVCTRRTIDGLAPPATSKLNAVRTLASSHDRCEESYEAPTSDIDAAIDVLLGKPPAVTQ